MTYSVLWVLQDGTCDLNPYVGYFDIFVTIIIILFILKWRSSYCHLMIITITGKHRIQGLAYMAEDHDAVQSVRQQLHPE